MVNDAAASLRGLAKSHGRNAQWADAAVRKASNLTAAEALQMNVIDLISPTLPALLKHDRRPRDDAAPPDAAHGGRADRRRVAPGFFTRFLSTLIDPNIVSLLFLAGLAGLGFELFHPGVVIPGAFGAICMVTRALRLLGAAALVGRAALVLLGAALLVIDAARHRRTAR